MHFLGGGSQGPGEGLLGRVKAGGSVEEELLCILTVEVVMQLSCVSAHQIVHFMLVNLTARDLHLNKGELFLKRF